MMDINNNYRKGAGLCSIAFYLLIALLLPAGKAVGQVKKELKEPDYQRWSFLISDNLSAKGNWASYRVKNPSGDTLFARNIQSGKQYAIYGGNEGRFYKEDYFAGIRADTLVLIHLKSGRTRNYPDCQFFDFNHRSGLLFTFSKYKDSGHTLQVFAPEGPVQMTLEGVTSWKWNSDQSKIAVAYSHGKQHAIAIMDGMDKNVAPLMTSGTPFSGLAWGGKFVSFIRDDEGPGRLYLLDTEKKILKECGRTGGKGIPKGMKLLGDFDFTVVSSDGERVFFAVSEPPSTAPEPPVQIWRADDKQLYPRKQMYGDVYLQHKFGLWQVESDDILMLSDRQYPLASGSGSASHALLWDPMQYEPQTDYDGPYDIYLMDLATAGRVRVISNPEGNSSGFYLDPQGDYLYYARDYHWWVYDIRRQLHRNLTQALDVEFDNRQYDRAGKRPMYGAAGFAAGGASLIVYDQYDCWELFPDGGKARQLTHGRKDHITYRLAETEPGHRRRMHGYENLLGVYDTNSPLVFTAANRSGKFEGYYSRTGKGQMQVLYKADQQLESLAKASEAEVFTFTAQRYDLPPQLLSVKPGHKISLIYQSNKQQQEYHWGRSEIVYYQVGGKKLTGVLIFPANYHKNRTYPMIVSIYEKQSYLLNAYVNPSAYNMTGFNPANLSAKGYFILLPDIAYRMREMGDSATDCVLAAVDAVINDYPVDPGRLGLTGHSFGGYQTDYIITQTGRFKAAVSGAALTDLVSSYLYVGGNHGRPDFWRFEHQQQRMEKSLFDGLSHYLDNSPIFKADRVSTPLLSWTGENDRHVNYLQSVEFYLALRRMGKEHTLLVYPGEEHVILDRDKQKDLTSRFEAWFDRYLMP